MVVEGGTQSKSEADKASARPGERDGTDNKVVAVAVAEAEAGATVEAEVAVAFGVEVAGEGRGSTECMLAAR